MNDIEEIIDYSIVKGLSSGRVEIVFRSVPDKDITTMILAIKRLCEKARSDEGCGGKPEEPPQKTGQKPEEQKPKIVVNSKVIQISGKAPAVGIGTVTSELADGRVKVKFFRNFKVLTRNNFKLATEDDIDRARVAGLPT